MLLDVILGELGLLLHRARPPANAYTKRKLASAGVGNSGQRQHAVTIQKRNLVDNMQSGVKWDAETDSYL